MLPQLIKDSFDKEYWSIKSCESFDVFSMLSPKYKNFCILLNMCYFQN